MAIENLLLFIILFPTVCSAIAYFIGTKNEKSRNHFLIFVTLINFLVVLYLFKFIKFNTLELSIPYIMGTGLHFKLNSFRYIFIFITSFVWFVVTVYSSQYLINYIHRNRYYLFFMITYVSTLGIFISENLLNLFAFFEIMSFASYPLIIHDEDESAHSAGRTYIIMATAGGLILLMGIFILFTYTNTLDISLIYYIMPKLGSIKYIISSLIIIGFGIKAGMVPLHIWLPKAHPAAPTPASAILSGILVKTGIFGIILTVVFMMDCDYYLSIAMVVLGFMNMFIGGFLALFQNNIKKNLAYSSMSQMGYLFLGIGCIGLLGDHQAIAVYGTLFHVFNHAIFKVMLFMGIGIIYMVTHKLDINDLQGFGRFKPVLKLTFFVGFCAIIGLPGFNGFASKTMIHHALTEAGHYNHSNLIIFGDLLFYLSSAFTTAYLLKLYIALFVENNSRYYASYKRDINLRALFPMVISAILIVIFGISPSLFLNNFEGISEIFDLSIHGAFEIDFYSFSNILSSIITIGLGILIYVLFINKKLISHKDGKKVYTNPSKNWFSLEKNIYRPIIIILFKFSTIILHTVDNILLTLYNLIYYTIKYISNIEIIDYENSYKKVAEFFSIIYNSLKRKVQKTDKSNIKFDYATLESNLEEKSNVIKTTVAKDFKDFSDKMNSITYSIFLFGSVLVIVMLAVLIFR